MIKVGGNNCGDKIRATNNIVAIFCMKTGAVNLIRTSVKIDSNGDIVKAFE